MISFEHFKAAANRNFRALIFSSLLFVAAAGFATAQTGRITGRVADPSGAAVPSAPVTVIQTSTNQQRSTQTSTDGYYDLSNLTPGEYSIKVESRGFKPTTETGIRLQVGQDLALDLTLQVGAVNEQVVVEAQVPLLDTESHSVSQTIQGNQIVNLPMLGRNAYSLGSLVPGVRVSRGMNDLPVDQISTSSVSINGAPGNANEFLLDGAPNTAAAQNQPIIYPNADSVQEFRVETNNFSAEYGRAAGGVFNVVTKAGTNNLHGDLYEFLRNDKLNSNDFFANMAGRNLAPFKFNQFGGVLGGPVVIPHLYDGRNKTFFFVSTELVRFIQGVTYTATVPDPVQLTGNFSSLRTATGQPITIYDPATTTLASGKYTRSAFAGNVIPSSRINPVAAKILTYWPAPNVSGVVAAGASNYVRTDSNNIQKNTFSTRLDQNFTANTRMLARYSYDDTPWVRASPYGFSDPGSPAFGPQDFTRYNSVAELDHVFSPTLVGTVRATYSRLANQRTPLSNGFDISQLGLPSGFAQQVGSPAAFPAIDITGYTVGSSVTNNSRAGTLGETGLIKFGMNNYAFQANVTKIVNQHTFKVGGEFRVIQLNAIQTGDASNDFSFTNAFTQGPNAAQASATAGNALATFLLGLPAGSVTPSAALALQTKYYAGFFQDDWRISKTFTMNVGLRYDLETPRTDRYNQLTNFDYHGYRAAASGQNPLGALTFVGVGGNSRYDGNVDANNLAPRLGFAWHVTPKTVIRAGGGIFYGTSWGFGSQPSQFGISGFTAATTLVSSIDGVTPTASLSNPYPSGLNAATGSRLGAATLLGQDISFYDRGNVTPYTGQWNFDLQRQLPLSLLLEVAYVGTRGLKLPLDRQVNQLPDSALALGDGLRTLVANPFYGQITSGALAGATVSKAQLLRPYPQYTAITSAVSSWGSSSYHALQVKLEKRYSKNLTMLVSYTYSKLMDIGAGTFGGETLSGGAIQNWNNLGAEFSPSALDQTHRFIANVVYSIPFFRSQSGFLGHVLGGWEVGVIGSFYSGSPLGITSSVNGTFSQGGGQRPNWNGVDPSMSQPAITQWFNTSVFSTPAAYTFGSTPRTFNSVRSDKTQTIDLSLHKNVKITERMALQIRAEAFNLANTPVFSPPGTTYGSSTFGVVNSQANQPRIVQLALKLQF
jgi:Carboxypeptidase regulatory-like domain/TonB-dependent Receptor Plug Domain